jgi:hypothetical protein
MPPPRPAAANQVAKSEHRRHAQVAASRVAGRNDVRGRDAAIQKPLVCGHGVFLGGGKGVLGREPVVDYERTHVRGFREVADEFAVARW